MPTSIKNGLAVIMFCGFASSVYYLFRSWWRSNSTSTNPRNQHINEILMFSPHSKRPVTSDSTITSLHPSSERLLYYLNLAHHSIDICMEMITSLDIACRLVDIHRRGVRIRLIVDGDMAFTPVSAVWLLEKQGIEVRISSVDTMFKNFCLIDTAPIIENVIPFSIFGSLVWTTESISGNSDEMVYVTSKLVFLDVLREEFDRIHAGAN